MPFYLPIAHFVNLREILNFSKEEYQRIANGNADFRIFRRSGKEDNSNED